MLSVDLVDIWQCYLRTVNDWKVLIKDRLSKQTACGPVYELANAIERANESFAIADMRNVPCAMPHYHRGETEDAIWQREVRPFLPVILSANSAEA
ncbi:MAG: hypothetical protein JSR80_01470 [Verrucomicrobia bacterium]|nr:hypothetical protein [Verrucomicrobiota bacterium]